MRVLILNQTFYPDVVSTAQHASDLASALADAGDDVTVIASRRGYDDPALRFPRRECWHGVRILRIGATSFGKAARWRRALDFASFLIACTWKLLWLPRQDVVITLTSPPLISFLGALMIPLKARDLVFWSMDLNPDEAIAAGWLNERSIFARLFAWMLKFSLRRARNIVALDRFMAERIAAKGVSTNKVVVLPPWSHDEALHFTAEGREEFRASHGLTGRFVVMHSGNHSPCHPLNTLLDAASELKNDPEICFCFIGGGSEMTTIKRVATTRQLDNVFCLPYQHRERLASSLSSADLHVVVMGDNFVGIVHPCKVYNVLALGLPVLYLGPPVSHVTELMARDETGVRGYRCRHGDVAAVVASIRHQRRFLSPSVHTASPVAKQFFRQQVVPDFVNLIHGKVAVASAEALAGSAQNLHSDQERALAAAADD